MKNKSYKDTVLRKWSSLLKTVSSGDEYRNTGISRIESALVSGNNHCFISSTYKRDMKVMMEMSPDSLSGLDLPKFSGIKISVEKQKEINPAKSYLTIRKEEGCSEELFCAFSATLIDEVSKSMSDKECVTSLVEVIEIYRKMFSKEMVQMSREEEQGLFCELSYLSDLIDRKGDSAVSNWVGFEGNKHDFVFDDCSVEIKSTSNQKQIILHISNENQLDKAGIDKLYLKAYRVEYVPSGRFIQDLIDEICAKISNAEMYMKFVSALMTKGIDKDVFKSKRCIRITNTYLYEVNENFPKISKADISRAVFDVKYSVNVSDVAVMDEGMVQL